MVEYGWRFLRARSIMLANASRGLHYAKSR
jgi:hypothetical protein